MSQFFEELDYRPTPIGTLILRRRREMLLNVDVFEIKLGNNYLMSSLFTATPEQGFHADRLPCADSDPLTYRVGKCRD